MLTLTALGELALHVTLRAQCSHAPQNDLRFDEIHLEIGASAALVCIQLVALDHRTQLVPLVADDELGRLLVRELEATGVEIPAVVVDGARTARSVTQTGRDGAHDTTYSAPDSNPQSLQPELPRASEGAYAYVPAYPGYDGLLEAASRVTTTLVVDLGYKPLVYDFPRLAKEAVERARWAQIAVVPCADLDDATTAQLAQAVSEAGPELTVVTRGARGAGLWTGSGLWTTPAIRCQPVNTLGAGDAFTAGLVAGLADGSAPETAVRFANAVAAARTEMFPAFPNRANVAGFLKRRNARNARAA
jgi:sugar/nucleoside kinase (ribokinase family)